MASFPPISIDLLREERERRRKKLRPVSETQSDNLDDGYDGPLSGLPEWLGQKAEGALGAVKDTFRGAKEDPMGTALSGAGHLADVLKWNPWTDLANQGMTAAGSDYQFQNPMDAMSGMMGLGPQPEPEPAPPLPQYQPDPQAQLMQQILQQALSGQQMRGGGLITAPPGPMSLGAAPGPLQAQHAPLPSAPDLSGAMQTMEGAAPQMQGLSPEDRKWEMLMGMAQGALGAAGNYDIPQMLMGAGLGGLVGTGGAQREERGLEQDHQKSMMAYLMEKAGMQGNLAQTGFSNEMDIAKALQGQFDTDLSVAQNNQAMQMPQAVAGGVVSPKGGEMMFTPTAATTRTRGTGSMDIGKILGLYEGMTDNPPVGETLASGNYPRDLDPQTIARLESAKQLIMSDEELRTKFDELVGQSIGLLPENEAHMAAQRAMEQMIAELDPEAYGNLYSAVDSRKNLGAFPK